MLERCTREIGLLSVTVVVSAMFGCTADFDLLDSALEIEETPEDLDTEVAPPDGDAESDDLEAIDELEAEEEIADTRADVPEAATCPAEGSYPADRCFVSLEAEGYVSSATEPVRNWNLSELPADEYNGLWIDLDVYHDGWRSDDSGDRHSLFRAQVAQAGTVVLPDTKLAGSAYLAPPSFVAEEQGMTANKASVKLPEDVLPGYWYHVQYRYFPAKDRMVQLDVTRDGTSILHDTTHFRLAADVARLRIVNGEELVLSFGYPSGHPTGILADGWEYRNVRVIAFSCGDGFVDESESCDTGDEADSAGCDSDCSAVQCGDNHLNAAVENCDDGNTNDNDSCPADCTIP